MKKIDDNKLLEMLREGKMQKEIAAHFGVSPVAVCQRLKRLRPAPESVLDRYDLTDKEKAFVIEKAKGRTNTQAALESYEVSNRESAKVIGSQLMDKPEINMAIGELMESHGLSRSYRIGRLKTHVDNQDPNVSLKALHQSWQLDGSYAPEKSLHAVASVPTEGYEPSLREVAEKDPVFRELLIETVSRYQYVLRSKGPAGDEEEPEE